MTPLPAISRGRKGPPLVFLHGFGFDGASWEPFAAPFAARRRIILFDLPGHGAALPYAPVPHAGTAAKAVIASLEALNIPRVTLVGHSLGGAVAALVGLLRPDMVERLVLLAPGGFGPQMDAAHLRRYAAAGEADLAALLPPFFAAAVPAGLAAHLAAARQDEALRTSLAGIVEAITKGDGQGTLPLDALAAAPFATSLVWGCEDRILPVAQAIAAPPEIARHLLPGVGHMPHLEAPETVAAILTRAVAGRLVP